MLALEYLSSSLSDDNAWSHGVASCNARHDGAIRDTKAVDSIDFEVAVYDRHGIASHLCGAGLMPIGTGRASHEILKIRFFETTWYHFTLGKGSQRSGACKLATELYSPSESPEIGRVVEMIRANLHWVEGIRARESDLPAAVGTYQAGDDTP